MGEKAWCLTGLVAPVDGHHVVAYLGSRLLYGIWLWQISRVVTADDMAVLTGGAKVDIEGRGSKSEEE